MAARVSREAQFDSAPDWSLSPIPRYIQLATLFRNRIGSGEWRVGERIPNVDVLAPALGVARETVRQAVGLLVEQGLLESTRAKGTFVRKTTSITVTHTLDINWSSLTLAHDGADLEILSRSVVRRLPGSDRSEGKPQRSYRMMRRRHSRDGIPYLVSTFYIDERIYKRIPARSFSSLSTLKILQQFADLKSAKGEQVMTIGSADVEVSALLDIPVNAPVGLLRREIKDADGVIIYLGLGIYRGDALRLEMSLR